MARRHGAKYARRGARIAREWSVVLAAVISVAISRSAHGQRVDQPTPAIASGAMKVSGSRNTGGQDFPWGPAPPGETHPQRDRACSLRHQELRVRFDDHLERVSGTTGLEILAGDAPVSIVDVDAMNMKIATVLDARGHALTYRYDERTIQVALPAPLAPRAPVTISIEYSVERPRAGVFVVASPRVVWTQGVLRDTRYWLPTIDDVDSRPTWMVEVRCPIGEQAVATGQLDMSGAVEGQAIWRWVESDPTPIRYLTIAVGPCVRLSDVPADSVRQPSLTVWALRDSQDSARVGDAAVTQTLTTLARLLGPPPRHGGVNLFVVPEFPFWTQLDDWRPVIRTTALDDVMEEVSHSDLGTFFKQWVYGAGFPFLDVTADYDTARRQIALTVRQLQRRDSLRLAKYWIEDENRSGGIDVTRSAILGQLALLNPLAAVDPGVGEALEEVRRWVDITYGFKKNWRSLYHDESDARRRVLDELTKLRACVEASPYRPKST